jgi:hypothetical protein
VTCPNSPTLLACPRHSFVYCKAQHELNPTLLDQDSVSSPPNLQWTAKRELSSHTSCSPTSSSSSGILMSRTSRRSASKTRSSPPSNLMVTHRRFHSRVIPLIPFHNTFFFVFADMAPLYESLAADSVLERDQGLLDSMRAKIDEEIKKLDEK